LKTYKTNIEGCLLIEPTVFKDARGNFMETFHKAELEKQVGGTLDFVQDNQSVSGKHVLRGLHYQKEPFSQAKLVRVVRGRVLDVVVDLRPDLPTFGHHYSVELSAENRKMLFIPRGLAHGFLALEDQTVFCYKCDAYYHPASEGGILYNDPDLGIDWVVDASKLILSEKDLSQPTFKELFS